MTKSFGNEEYKFAKIDNGDWGVNGPVAVKIDKDGMHFTASMAPKYKYKEDEIIRDFHAYIDKTYGQHYMTEEENIECFDVWLALGDSMPTFRNTAIKYLWRYGKKHGSNKDDLLKVLHYVIMMLYADHYRDKK